MTEETMVFYENFSDDRLFVTVSLHIQSYCPILIGVTSEGISANTHLTLESAAHLRDLLTKALEFDAKRELEKKQNVVTDADVKFEKELQNFPSEGDDY